MLQCDITKLVKILNMTFSDNDSEALSAIRHANSIVKKECGYWDKILMSVSNTKNEQKTYSYNENTGNKRNIYWPDGVNLFRKLQEQRRWDSFVTSVYEQYKRNGMRLSQKQIDAIRAKVSQR